MHDEARAAYFRLDLLRWIDANGSGQYLALVEDYLESPSAAFNTKPATVDDLADASVHLWRAGFIEGQYVVESDGLDLARVTPAGRQALADSDR